MEKLSLHFVVIKIFFVFFLGIAFFPHLAMGRMQYAVRYGIVDCKACHISPVGGGPKNRNGKLFAAHGYESNPAIIQDYISVDLRALYYFPRLPKLSRDGMGIMSGSVAGHVDLDAAKKITMVMEHNVAGFSAGAFRDTYGMFRFGDSGSLTHLFDSLMIGRFRAPFGFVTDEHRTYTRIQTSTQWFTMETGALLSGTPSLKLHYDLALLNGQNSAGESLDKGKAVRWGTVGNVRWLLGVPLLGASASHYNADVNGIERSALSLYTVVSIARWSEDRIPLSLILERTRAWGWNNKLGQGFANDTRYVDSLARAVSDGWLGTLEWALNQQVYLIYKYDLLIPDRYFPSDYYLRHGLGFRWAIGPNVILQARAEVAKATHPTEKNSNSVGAESASYAILQFEF